MTKYLVVAHETAVSPELVDAVTAQLSRTPDAAFVLLVPATPVKHLLTWEEGETREIARRRAQEATAELARHGIHLADSRVGDASPLAAIREELERSPGYDGIIISTHPPRLSRWLRQDVVRKAQSLFGLPVTHVTARGRVGVA